MSEKGNIIYSCKEHGVETYFNIKKLEKHRKMREYVYVWFKKVPSIIHTHDGYGQAGTKLPDLETTERGAEFRKKINVDEDGSETAYETYRGTIKPWTGQPINFDTYD